MKTKRLLSLAAALLLTLAGALAGDYSFYRVFFYVRGEPASERGGRPYKMTTIALSEAQCKSDVLAEEPKAYRFEIHRLDSPVSPEVEAQARAFDAAAAAPTPSPAATPRTGPSIAEGVDYSNEAGLPVDWQEDEDVILWKELGK